MRCRYTCAVLDVFFDLGYVLTYLVMVVIGTTELHVNVSVGVILESARSWALVTAPCHAFGVIRSFWWLVMV